MKTNICPLASLSVQVLRVQFSLKKSRTEEFRGKHRRHAYRYIEASGFVLPDLEKSQLFFFKTSPVNQEILVHPQPESKV